MIIRIQSWESLMYFKDKSILPLSIHYLDFSTFFSKQIVFFLRLFVIFILYDIDSIEIKIQKFIWKYYFFQLLQLK